MTGVWGRMGLCILVMGMSAQALAGTGPQRGFASWIAWGAPPALPPDSLSGQSPAVNQATWAKIVNLLNGRRVTVLLQPGAAVAGGQITLSAGAARVLRSDSQGVVPVQWVALSQASQPVTLIAPPSKGTPFLRSGVLMAVNPALRLQRQLLRLGLVDTHILPGLVHHKVRYRVSVGPLPQGVSATDLAEQLQKRGISGLEPYHQ